MGRRGVAVTAALLVLLAAGTSGCGVTEASVAAERLDLASHAAEIVHRDLQASRHRLEDALAGAEAALAEAGEKEGAALFDALAALQARTGVDGLLWEGPGGEQAWAGHPAPVPQFPPPAPWRASFRAGPFSWHEGPFLRALVAGPADVRGGMLTATVVVEELAPAEVSARPFATRWLAPLGVERIDILPPSAPTPDAEATLGFVLLSAEGTPLLRGVVTPPGVAAVRDRLETARREGVGFLLLVAWLAAVLATARFTARRTASASVRWLLLGLLVLAGRTALGWIDPASRFPWLARAFDPADFGIEDPFGWLASPADFVLTAAAFLLAAVCFRSAVRVMRRPGPRGWDAVALVAGVAAAAAVSALWVGIVELAVAQGQTAFFSAPSIVPSLPSALMLTGLVAATAAGWVLCVAALQVAASGSPRLSTLPWVLLPAAAAAVLALALAGEAGPSWATLLLPVASLAAFARPIATEEASAAPARVLLVGVLATILLFPLLWTRVGERRAEGLAATLDDLLRGEATAISSVLLDFGVLEADRDLAEALAAAREGPRPEGLALAVWLRTSFATTGAEGFVSLLDPEGRLLDEFTLTALARSRIPRPAPPTADAGDLQVVTARGDGQRVRCVVGRLRLRDAAGEALGHVVLTAPDPVDLALLGLHPEDAADTQVALLEAGHVVVSSDASVSREPGSFGPASLADLGPDNPELGWQREDEDGYAVWSWERGVCVAVRREASSLGDAVLALARLVVVGVGLACVLSAVLLLVGLRRLRTRLHHRILLSYFLISFIPIVVLGWASARDARIRHDASLSNQLEIDVRRARSDLEAMGPQFFDQATDAHLETWANLRGHEVLVYRDGTVFASSRPGLVEAELIGAHLPADAYRATALERREIVRRDASIAGRPVWLGCAPVLDSSGRPMATVGVPLLYDPRRVEERFALTGSVLIAAYLFTLVLVLVGGIWSARRIARPLAQMAAGTRRVAAGELDVVLEPAGSDELGELVGSFNTMTHELRRVTAQAARAEREMAWRRMARQVAHEIKNPLTPIRLMIQQMEADVARDPTGALDAIRRTAPVVLRQIESLGRIAADFAHFARLPKRDLEDVDVTAVARDVVALHGGSAEHGVEVVAEIGAGVPVVHWDAGEIRRVLINLVGNAVQAIPGAGRVRVVVRPAERDGRAGVQVDVADTGTGIAEQDLGRLFEPDFSTKTAGTGLGLAMVKRTVDDLGGSITVESTPGEGSTFRMWWPARPDTGAATA